MDKAKIKVIFKEIFLFFASPAVMFIAITGFIFVSFMIDMMIRYAAGNYETSAWIMNMAAIMDRASFYPYLFAYPLSVLLRIELKEKRKRDPGFLASKNPETQEQKKKRKRALIRESILFLIFIFLGVLPFLGIYDMFGVSLAMSLNLGLLGLLVMLLYLIYLIVRYILIGIFIRGIIWCIRKIINKPAV